MNQIKFFYDDELIMLQEKINVWLQENKEVKILDTNLTSLGKPATRAGSTGTEKYVFYILYSPPAEAAAIMYEETHEAVSVSPPPGANIVNLTN